MKEIKLGRSELVTLVDDEDFERVNQYGWWVSRYRHTNYARGYINSKYIRLHRFLLNPDKGLQVDHANGNGLDNRRCNLRICTNAQNQHNIQTSTSYGGKPTYSKFKGVTWDKKNRKWRAQGMINYKQYHLGRFKIEIEAAKAYNKFAKNNFGEFASLNNI